MKIKKFKMFFSALLTHLLCVSAAQGRSGSVHRGSDPPGPPLLPERAGETFKVKVLCPENVFKYFIYNMVNKASVYLRTRNHEAYNRLLLTN